VDYNQISIKNLTDGTEKIYTVKEIPWVKDMQLQVQCLTADHVTINQQELWIARLHESTGLEDTELRKMSRRLFETLMTKWIEINDVDQTAFLATSQKTKKT